MYSFVRRSGAGILKFIIQRASFGRGYKQRRHIKDYGRFWFNHALIPNLVLGTRWLRREALSRLQAVVRWETAVKSLALNFKQRQTLNVVVFLMIEILTLFFQKLQFINIM
jgi:hypothetical protein